MTYGCSWDGHALHKYTNKIPTVYSQQSNGSFHGSTAHPHAFLLLFLLGVPFSAPHIYFRCTHEPTILIPYHFMYLVSNCYIIRVPSTFECVMKFEDLLMQRGEEKQKRLDLEEEVRTCALFLSW